MTKTFATTLRTELERDLEALKKKHGITIEIGRMTIYPENITAKLTFTPKRKSGISDDQTIFESRCHLHGLKPSDFGKILVIGSDRYKISGCAERRSKYSIFAIRLSDNDPRKLNLIQVKEILLKMEQ